MRYEAVEAMMQRLQEQGKRFENDDWDKQIKADAASGKLDDLFADDIAAFEKRQYRPL